MSGTTHLLVPAWCQFCEARKPADFDTKTTFGPWAYVCGPHFVEVGLGDHWTRVTWNGKD